MVTTARQRQEMVVGYERKTRDVWAEEQKRSRLGKGLYCRDAEQAKANCRYAVDPVDPFSDGKKSTEGNVSHYRHPQDR